MMGWVPLFSTFSPMLWINGDAVKVGIGMGMCRAASTCLVGGL